jgi:hypothetical protein
VSGRCQPSGYCSFPDDACPSGQRYGDHAGGSLAGGCVDPSREDTGSSGGVSTSPVTTSTPTSTTSPPTTGVDGPVTTEPVGESDTAGSSGTIGTGDDDPGTTGEPARVVCWGDEFDDGTVDDAVWCVGLDPGITVDEADDHLRFALSPTEWGRGSALGYAATCDWFPLLGAEATTEVVAVPQVSPHTEAFIELGNHDLRLGMGILGGELYAFVFDGNGYAGASWQPYEPAAHRYLRVVGTEEGLVAESSPDGVAWAHVFTEPAELAGAEGYVALGVWGEMVPLGPDVAELEWFELCWLEDQI